ncbi:unnamed protein product [Protopolystoma xenopodis]|uniref:Uncharacterized protein n=1 Tax=Protopolystoma xenopodis TaxID=117903 RepID=A0A3S5BPF7_9PLAT|nr:unnamed protein product [Protopolystoma xenopodis]
MSHTSILSFNEGRLDGTRFFGLSSSSSSQQPSSSAPAVTAASCLKDLFTLLRSTAAGLSYFSPDNRRNIESASTSAAESGTLSGAAASTSRLSAATFTNYGTRSNRRTDISSGTGRGRPAGSHVVREVIDLDDFENSLGLADLERVAALSLVTSRLTGHGLYTDNDAIDFMDEDSEDSSLTPLPSLIKESLLGSIEDLPSTEEGLRVEADPGHLDGHAVEEAEDDEDEGTNGDEDEEYGEIDLELLQGQVNQEEESRVYDSYESEEEGNYENDEEEEESFHNPSENESSAAIDTLMGLGHYKIKEEAFGLRLAAKNRGVYEETSEQQEREHENVEDEFRTKGFVCNIKKDNIPEFEDVADYFRSDAFAEADNDEEDYDIISIINGSCGGFPTSDFIEPILDRDEYSTRLSSSLGADNVSTISDSYSPCQQPEVSKSPSDNLQHKADSGEVLTTSSRLLPAKQSSIQFCRQIMDVRPGENITPQPDEVQSVAKLETKEEQTHIATLCHETDGINVTQFGSLDSLEVKFESLFLPGDEEISDSSDASSSRHLLRLFLNLVDNYLNDSPTVISRSNRSTGTTMNLTSKDTEVPSGKPGVLCKLVRQWKRESAHTKLVFSQNERPVAITSSETVTSFPSMTTSVTTFTFNDPLVVVSTETGSGLGLSRSSRRLRSHQLQFWSPRRSSVQDHDNQQSSQQQNRDQQAVLQRDIPPTSSGSHQVKTEVSGIQLQEDSTCARIPERSNYLQLSSGQVPFTAMEQSAPGRHLITFQSVTIRYILCCRA